MTKPKQVVGVEEMTIIEVARQALLRSSAAGDLRKDRGWWWACYCPTCCNLRKVLA